MTQGPGSQLPGSGCEEQMHRISRLVFLSSLKRELHMRGIVLLERWKRKFIETYQRLLKWAAAWQYQQKWPVRPEKTQISLGIRTDWWESSLCAQRVAKDPMFLHADNEDSDQIGLMPRLIWVFAGRTGLFVVGFVMLRPKCWIQHNRITHNWNKKVFYFLLQSNKNQVSSRTSSCFHHFF